MSRLAEKHRKERLGMVFTHPKYGEYEIVEYRSALDITVKFENTGSLLKTQFSSAKNSTIRDPYHPSVLGVGITGSGSVMGSCGKHLKSYTVWCSMLARCYCEKKLSRQPNYRGCSVCEGWLYYPNFKIWFDNYYIKGLALDKDIKVAGNKIYSPETCMFVTPSENALYAVKDLMYTVIVASSDGVEHKVSNQAKFCRDRGLSSGNFNMMITGGYKTSQGYTLVRRLGEQEAEDLTNNNGGR